MTGRDQTFALLAVHSHTRGIQKISLSLASCSQSVWYYSQLNEGFIEATWIKRATATMYLLLCNAVNRFAEWGSNVFLYTNRRWNDALGGWASSEATAGTLWCVMETLSSSTGGLHVDSADNWCWACTASGARQGRVSVQYSVSALRWKKRFPTSVSIYRPRFQFSNI